MRPKIICHMVSSIDGRLLVSRWSQPARGEDRRTLLNMYEDTATQLQADGWLVGRKTMADFATGDDRTALMPSVASEALHTELRKTFVAEPVLVAGQARRPVAIGVDPHGKLHYGPETGRGEHRIAILGEQVSDAYLTELREDGVSYLFAGPKGDDLALAMRILALEFGVQTLLLEGGGILNGAFLQAKLIDEISLLIYPGIDGMAGMPSIFEYIGADSTKPAAGLSLRHLSTETLAHGMVWLRYQVEVS
jgi:riboflavin biosynthesis pyrimidine reductase